MKKITDFHFILALESRKGRSMKTFLFGLVLMTTLASCGGTTGGATKSANIVFSSSAGGYNGGTTNLTTTDITIVGIIVTSSQGTGAAQRRLTAFLPLNSRVEGTTYSIAATIDAGVMYTEGDPSTGKLWTASGGSIKVLVKSGKTLSYQLIDVTLTKTASNTSPSVGAVTINGTITGESITPL